MDAAEDGCTSVRLTSRTLSSIVNVDETRRSGTVDIVCCVGQSGPVYGLIVAGPSRVQMKRSSHQTPALLLLSVQLHSARAHVGARVGYSGPRLMLYKLFSHS